MVRCPPSRRAFGVPSSVRNFRKSLGQVLHVARRRRVYGKLVDRDVLEVLQAAGVKGDMVVLGKGACGTVVAPAGARGGPVTKVDRREVSAEQDKDAVLQRAKQELHMGQRVHSKHVSGVGGLCVVEGNGVVSAVYCMSDRITLSLWGLMQCMRINEGWRAHVGAAISAGMRQDPAFLENLARTMVWGGMRALLALRKAGVTHNDISLGNMGLALDNGKPVLKVFDLGQATDADEGAVVCGTGETMPRKHDAQKVWDPAAQRHCRPFEMRASFERDMFSMCCSLLMTLLGMVTRDVYSLRDRVDDRATTTGILCDAGVSKDTVHLLYAGRSSNPHTRLDPLSAAMFLHDMDEYPAESGQ